MQPCAPAPVAPIDGQHVELADIKSQYLAKRALEIAAGGGHNLFGVGLPRRPGLGYASSGRSSPWSAGPLRAKSPSIQISAVKIHVVTRG
jgi:magnesium chelatase family protein